MFYYCFCIYLPAGIIGIPAVVGSVASAGATLEVISLYDVFLALFPAGKSDDRMSSTPDADRA